MEYKAKSISTGKEVQGELAYDGLSCFIIEKWPYGTSTAFDAVYAIKAMKGDQRDKSVTAVQ